MYDEDLIEDSLAFVKGLKSVYNAGEENATSNIGASKSENKISNQNTVGVQPQARPIVPQTQAQPQARTVAPQPQVPVQPQARPVAPQPQVPVQPQARPIAPQPQVQAQVPLQPQARPIAPQPQVQAQVQAQPQARPVAPQPQVQAQVPVQPQARPVAPQPQVQVQPQARPVAPQPQVQAQVQAQPQARPVTPQPQVQAQVSVQPQARPVAPQPQVQAQPQARPAAPQPQVQAQVQAQPQARPAAPQPQVQAQVPVQPQARPAAPQPQVQAQVQAQPQIKQTVPQQIEKKESSVADEAIEKLKAKRKAEQEAKQVEEAAKQNSELAAEAETIRELPAEEKHTYEITIKFDFDSIKKLGRKLKEKITPEARTLEDVNAAMEENRQIQAEKEQQEPKSFSDTSKEMAVKAKETISKLPKLAAKKTEAVSGEATETGDAVDAEIKTLEGDVSKSKLAGRLEDVKEFVTPKVSFASHFLTNAIILVFCVIIAFFFASFVTNYVAHQTTVEGESMEPTLADGDTVIIQRMSYYFSEPERFDVVVFPVAYDDPTESNTYYIKRVIGMPGESVQIIDGSVYIDGEKLEDDKYALSDILDAGIASSPVVLGKDQYFVMGDNRNMSTDSRNSYVGLVNRRDIIGEAWICTWPLNHFGSLKR